MKRTLAVCLLVCAFAASAHAEEKNPFKRFWGATFGKIGKDQAPPPPAQTEEVDIDSDGAPVEKAPPAPPPPPPGSGIIDSKTVRPAFGDQFNNNNPDSEPEIRDARQIFAGPDANQRCSPQDVEFDPCPNAWFNDARLSPAVKKERDELGSLAALAVVNEDWQFASDDAKADPALANLPRRGHNIGGVLVDDTGRLVWWERNSNTFECSGANHGEVRMMLSYLKFARRSTLACHTIYTSLEPCAMCSGMMTQQKVARTLYVQKDHGFGAALERLQAPSPGFPGGRGFACGFPRATISIHSKIKESSDLDREFHRFFHTRPPADDLTTFLQIKAAHDVYQSATDRLENMTVLPENRQLHADIKAMLNDLRSPLYKRAYVTIDQHVQIERMRRSRPLTQQQLQMPRLGMPLDQDPCCRVPPLSGIRPAVAPQQPAFCRPGAPVLTPIVPVAVTPPRNPNVR